MKFRVYQAKKYLYHCNTWSPSKAVAQPTNDRRGQKLKEGEHWTQKSTKKHWNEAVWSTQKSTKWFHPWLENMVQAWVDKMVQ